MFVQGQTIYHIKATTSCKNSGNTSPSWGVINFPIISHTALHESAAEVHASSLYCKNNRTLLHLSHR